MIHICNIKRTAIIQLLYKITNIKIRNEDNNNIFTTCIFRAKKKILQIFIIWKMSYIFKSILLSIVNLYSKNINK